MKICLILEKFSPVVFPWLCKEDITSVGHAALVDGVEGHDGHVEEHLGGVAWTQSHGYMVQTRHLTLDTSHLTPETFPIRLTIKCQTWRHWQWNLLLMTPPLSRHPANIENHILFRFPFLPNKLVTGPPPPLTRVWGLLGKIWLPWSNYPNYPPWP